MICAAGRTTPTCSGRTRTRSSSLAPDRTQAPTCRAITWSPSSRPRSAACSPQCASVGRLLLPWTRTDAGTGFGIPFIDYRRGDGPGVGPGEAKTWRPVLVDDQTPWLHDYRGLWGLDTGDPFGGERAPAGPRYERGGSVRLCWSDPVGWAGLDKEAPSPAAERRAVAGRITEVGAQLAAATEEVEARGDELRRARVGIQALSSGGSPADPAALSALENSVAQARARRQALTEERDALVHASAHGLPREDPHAHLRHRALPNVDPARSPQPRSARVVQRLGIIPPGRARSGYPRPSWRPGARLRRGDARHAERGSVRPALSRAIPRRAGRCWLPWPPRPGWHSGPPQATGARPLAALLILAAVVLLLANIRDFFIKR